VYRKLSEKWIRIDEVTLGAGLIYAVVALLFSVMGDINKRPLWLILGFIFMASFGMGSFMFVVLLGPLWVISYLVHYFQFQDLLHSQVPYTLEILVLTVVTLGQFSDCFVQEAPYLLESLLSLLLLF